MISRTMKMAEKKKKDVGQCIQVDGRQGKETKGLVKEQAKCCSNWKREKKEEKRRKKKTMEKRDGRPIN